MQSYIYIHIYTEQYGGVDSSVTQSEQKDDIHQHSNTVSGSLHHTNHDHVHQANNTLNHLSKTQGSLPRREEGNRHALDRPHSDHIGDTESKRELHSHKDTRHSVQWAETGVQANLPVAVEMIMEGMQKKHAHCYSQEEVKEMVEKFQKIVKEITDKHEQEIYELKQAYKLQINDLSER